MPVSRRSFVATLGAGATGILAAPLMPSFLTWRGHEELLAFQGQADRPTTAAHQDKGAA